MFLTKTFWQLKVGLIRVKRPLYPSSSSSFSFIFLFFLIGLWVLNPETLTDAVKFAELWKVVIMWLSNESGRRKSNQVTDINKIITWPNRVRQLTNYFLLLFLILRNYYKINQTITTRKVFCWKGKEIWWKSLTLILNWNVYFLDLFIRSHELIPVCSEENEWSFIVEDYWRLILHFGT